ncbi:MAG TPA: aminopeptidase P family protein [Acidobacteriaceae bacterium]|nr:aminopeptidase P family protein [Acidobacteriaceae bacterium]
MSLNARKKQAMRAAKVAGVDALLVTHLPDVRWLTGFTGSNAALVLSGSRAVLFTDGRYTTQAKAEASGMRVVIAPKSAMIAACEWIAKARITRCGFDEGNTTVASLDQMRKAVPAGVRRKMFAPVGSLIAKLRWTKDADEVAKMRAAAALGCRLFESILSTMEPGMTETAVAAELEHAARNAGAEAMSFPTIVASGERSALPHGMASRKKLPRRGFVTLDFGVVLDGYCSDMTRTVHLGRATPQERAAYEAVLAAQEAGVAAVRAGTIAGDVDEAARSVLRTAGLADWFTHSTGHGVGLEIHEGPRLAQKQTQRLETGMIVTIEPGVYLPGKFGVRIEDMVLVTPTGGEILTTCTKAWIEL